MAQSGSNKVPPPKGTRDLYPQDLLSQRYITEAWRRVSIRHGFEEIAGPTFEMLDLYKKKSGEGIVSELFSFTRAGGDDDYALRPEFTPTLARMYAERAKQLPSPCKWFTAGPYFRAEKPQRGRLREFMQWNCDVMGGEERSSRLLYDTEVMSVIITMLHDFGLSKPALSFRLSDRDAVAKFLRTAGVPDERVADAFAILDKRAKLQADAFAKEAESVGLDIARFDTLCSSNAAGSSDSVLTAAINADRNWMALDYSIVRGLAYYTGTVFELIADGERAVAGGGRYDNLIELFGGPPTPAVGFGMGDVVLGLLLEDKGLMPEGPELMDALSQKPASLRPEAFVIANEEGEEHVEPLLAELRRGKETESFEGKPWDAGRYEAQPMHARRSYKSTKNIGKLLGDARKQHAKFAVIIENNSDAKIENLDTREEVGTFSFDQVGAKLAEQL
jgi:histidyl-tRNA synthetase